MTAKLHIEREGETSEFELRDGLVVGRGKGADLRLDDLTLAKRHLRFSTRDGAWWVEDLDTPAGAWLDDHQLRGPARLAPGQTLRAGATTFRLEIA